MRRVSLAAATAAALALACGSRDASSPDPATRAAAVRRTTGGGSRGLAALLLAQGDPSPLVRVAAAEAFAARGGPAAADGLGKLLLDPAPEVAAAAARGLGDMPAEPRARVHLVAAYADATPGGRAAIADALDRIGVSVREAIEAEARALWERNAAALDGARGAARWGAAEELGGSGRSDAVQKLLPFVNPPRNPDSALVVAAARGLGEAGDWHARGALEALLSDRDGERAEAAATALGRLGDPAAADALAAAGTAELGRISAAVVEALAMLPEAPEVGVALCDLAIQSVDPGVAGRAAREARRRDADCPERPLVAKLARPGAAAALAALAEVAAPRSSAEGPAQKVAALVERGPDAYVRAAAARAAAKLGGPSATTAVERRVAAIAARLVERRARWIAAPAGAGAPPEWIDPVAPDDAREAGALLAAAGRLRVGGAGSLLLAHARDPRPEVRAGAVDGLSVLGGGASLDAVAAALSDPDPAVRVAAVDGLGRMGAHGATALVGAAKAAAREPPEIRIAIARALGETGSVEAIPALAALLEGPSAAAAAGALSRIGAPAAAAPLIGYIARADASARAEAIEALAQLVARDAAPQIATLLTADRPDVRAAAARAVGRLRHEAAAARLEALRSDYYGRVRRAAVEALSKLPSGVQRVRR